MQKSDKPLFFTTIFWVLGIIVSRFYPLPIYLILLIIAVTFIIAITNSKSHNISILFLFFSLGFIHSQISQIKPSNHVFNIIGKYGAIKQPLVGKICSEVIKGDKSYHFDLELISIAETSMAGKICFYSQTDSLQFGDIIYTVASLNPIAKVSNPSGFDLREYYLAKNISATGFSQTVIKVLDNEASLFPKAIVKSRKFIRKRIEQRCGKYSGFIKAIVIADRSNIDAESKILRDAGLSHLLAVSGLHVAIIALLIYSIINIIIPNRKISRTISILTLFSYAAICNFSPSVSRAVLMISLFLLSKMLYRKIDLTNILSLSLFIITIFNPNQLFSIGLQMSFIAVITLGTFIPKIKLIPIPELSNIVIFSIKIANGIILIILSSFILSIFLAPISIYNFNQFNLNGIIANIIGIPIVSVILSLSILVISLPSFQLLLELYQLSLKFVLDFFFWWAKLISNFPLNWKFLSISLLQVFVTYFLLVIVFHKKSKTTARILSLAFLIIIFIPNFQNKKFEITYFDCGLGDLFLIKSDKNKTILIDTGPAKSGGLGFENSALPYLKENNISSLDYVIITHAHNDHYGGLKTVLAELEVKNIVVTDEFISRRIWGYFEKEITEEKANIITISDTISFNFTDFKIKIIHPDSKFSNQNINNMSIVTKLIIDSTSFLFMGDLEKEGEDYLLQKYPKYLQADILKIGHHGSKTASSPEFIKAVNPKIAIIPTSVKNRFNFPHQITLDKFEYLGEHLLITGKDGAIQIYPNDNKYYISTVLSKKKFVLSK